MLPFFQLISRDHFFYLGNRPFNARHTQKIPLLRPRAENKLNFNSYEIINKSKLVQGHPKLRFIIDLIRIDMIGSKCDLCLFGRGRIFT